MPVGYHVVEESNRGLVIAGVVTWSISYAGGAFAAKAANFANESRWMLVPGLGPWITLVTRDYANCERGDYDGDGETEANPNCLKDMAAILGLWIDGMVQGTGAALLIAGVLAKKKKLLRDDMHVSIGPGHLEFGMQG